MVTNNMYLKMVNVVFHVLKIVLVAMMVSQLMEEHVILMKFVLMVNPLVNLHGNALFLVMLIAQIVIVQQDFAMVAMLLLLFLLIKNCANVLL